jgi:signal transduction histidine kinase
VGATFEVVFARFRTTPADALIALALAVVLELEIVLGGEPGAGAASLVAGLAISVPLAWRRLVPLEVVLVYAVVGPLQGLLGGELFTGDPPLAGALAAGAVSFYSLAAYAPDRRATAGLLAGIAGMWAGVLASDAVDVQSFVFSAGLIGLAPWLAGRATRARRLRSEALERERDQRARAAASEERQRIARELHDVVAHGVVLMVLQAQGARRILDHDRDRAREALEAIEETGQTALAEIRRSLGILRDDRAPAELAPQRSLDDLGALVDEMREVGLQVDLRVRGPRRELRDGVDRSAYRIVQEALTNTIKHAGLVPTHVTVSYEPDSLVLEVADEGGGATGDGAGAGQGLAGMRERVRLHGGELDAHPVAGRGFVVRARIPVAA